MQEYTNFCSGLYNLVIGQCTESLKERLKSHEDFIDASQNSISLLVLICSLLHTFEERRKLADGLSDVKMAFYKLHQGKYMKLERYHELFLAQVDILNEVGVTIPTLRLYNTWQSSMTEKYQQRLITKKRSRLLWQYSLSKEPMQITSHT